MDRHDCEKIILEKLKDIISIYHEYNPNGKYLTLSYSQGEEFEGIEIFNINNAYFGEDSEFPIKYNSLHGRY